MYLEHLNLSIIQKSILPKGCVISYAHSTAKKDAFHWTIGFYKPDELPGINHKIKIYERKIVVVSTNGDEQELLNQLDQNYLMFRSKIDYDLDYSTWSAKKHL